MIGTAKNPNNKGFDLFITTAPIPDLNDKLVVFGRVIKGEDVVQVLSEFLFLGSFQSKNSSPRLERCSTLCRPCQNCEEPFCLVIKNPVSYTYPSASEPK
jgi:cyclophilin family peptidyl-prolyl cis-trans isomerase